jgi:carboxypeptidase Taq
MNLDDKLKTLRERLGEISGVGAAIALLEWDQETYMPPQGAAGRGLQLATIVGIAHRLFTATDLGDLLRELRDERDKLCDDDNAIVSETLYDYERARKLPESFVKEFAEVQSAAFNVWMKAREESDFTQFKPYLSRIVELCRAKADMFGYEDSPYDALLEEFERGARTKSLKIIFAELAERQGALVREASCRLTPVPEWLSQEWNDAAQWSLSIRMLKDIGFNMNAGRQDRSAHPFTTTIDYDDIRVTTRIHADQLFSGLLSSLHEGGHALYEQGFLEKDARTPLCQAPSLGMHESQSRLWENIIGRSLPFWEYYLPILREYFPGKLDSVNAEDIHRAINRVEPSLIRTEADECTYNLHIIVRFEIETGLIEGNVKVEDVPALWSEKMRKYLGIEAPNDAQGCLQDVHWSHGSFGYFPTYALGNLYSAQIFEKASQDMPHIWDDVASGNFSPLREWLRVNVHQRGRRKTAPELVMEITGMEPTADAYLRYLTKKCSSL